MKKSLIGAAIVLLPFLSFSQKNSTPKDSANYYRKEIEKAYKNAFESVQQTQLFKDYIAYSKRKNNYSGMALFATGVQSDYGQFNDIITAKGFPALNSMGYGFGIGSATKVNHILVDIYFVSTTVESKSIKGNETIASSLGNFLQVDLGYDILHNSQFSIYPFAGLSGRLASLRYYNKGINNPSYTNITDLVTGNSSVNTSSFRLGYQAGLGADVKLTEGKDNKNPIILFAKVGINKPFSDDVYKVNGQKYDPKIDKGNLNIAFGFKFATR